MKQIPWWQPKIGQKEFRLIHKVLTNNFPNEGQLTIEFENKLEKLLKVKHAIAVTSGTAAIYLSLKAYGIGIGDEVIVPDVSFIATANAVVMAGAKVVLADVDPDSLTLSLDRFKKLITRKTKAVIPVHVSGKAAKLKEIKSLAYKNKIVVIEDAAEAFMSKYHGKYLGTIGNTGCFSLSPAKTITTGQGGIIVTNNNRIALKLRELKDQGRPKRGTGGDDIHESIGFNFKFTDLQAAVGIGQLDYLEKRIARIRKTYSLYRDYLSNVKNIQIREFNIKGGEIPQWIEAYSTDRDKLDKYLLKNNISCRRFWHPIHRQKPYLLPDTDFPNSSLLSPKTIWLPSSFTMSDYDVKIVCDKIKSFFKQ